MSFDQYSISGCKANVIKTYSLLSLRTAQQIGIPATASNAVASVSNNIVASLISAEKSKFQRGRGSNTSRTDSSSQITLTGEQITRELFSDNMQLLSFAITISPLGLFGLTITYFLYGTPPNGGYKTLHNIDKSKFPNASNMAQQAFARTQSNILERADSIWKSKQRNYHYGGSYKSPDPST